MNITIKYAETEQDDKLLYPLMHQLRKQLSLEHYLSQLKRMKKLGYQLIFLQESDQVLGLVGFQIRENFIEQRHIYINDLVISQKQQQKGYGKKLITWIIKLAHKENIKYIILDTGITRKNTLAFYQHCGFKITASHLMLDLHDI